MFQRKLKALDYHSSEYFNWEDDKEYKAVIVWLEDRKIRHYKSKDRRRLRNTDDINWNNAFDKYVKDVLCPYDKSNKKLALEWLLGYALRLVNKFDHDNKLLTEGKFISTEGKLPVAENIFDKLNFDDDAFKEGINSMARMLQITPHSNHLITLKAITKIITERLNATNLQKSNSQFKEDIFPVNRCRLLMDLGDPNLNLIAKILHLLYIQDLHELQSNINDCIIAIQSVTANPETDASLGKVGTF